MYLHFFHFTHQNHQPHHKLPEAMSLCASVNILSLNSPKQKPQSFSQRGWNVDAGGKDSCKENITGTEALPLQSVSSEHGASCSIQTSGLTSFKGVEGSDRG